VPTLVATAGASNANVFADQATADAYMEARPFASAWEGEDDDDVKERALLFATKILDRLKWAGTKADADAGAQLAAPLRADARGRRGSGHHRRELSSTSRWRTTTRRRSRSSSRTRRASSRSPCSRPRIRSSGTSSAVKVEDRRRPDDEYFASQEDIRGHRAVPARGRPHLACAPVVGARRGDPPHVSYQEDHAGAYADILEPAPR
jgi:hypothetical protein